MVAISETSFQLPRMDSSACKEEAEEEDDKEDEEAEVENTTNRPSTAITHAAGLVERVRVT